MMEYTKRWIEGYVGESDDYTEPLTAIYYPVLADALGSIHVKSSETADMVGLLAM
jgi:hypothetical protein